MMKKKILSLFVAGVLALSSVTALAEVPKTETKDFLKSTELLGYEGESDSVVTRGEFAMLAAKLIASGDTGVKDSDPFSDVPESHPAYGAITLLHQEGHVNGAEGSNFYPDNNIILDHAVKIVIHIMGYDHLLQNMNYVAAANTKGLLKGVECNANQTITYDNALRIIYNALEADISDYNRYDGNKTGEYGNELMAKRLGIVRVKGVVTDDGTITLDGSDSAVKTGFLKIDNVIFENKTGRDDLFAAEIEGFYRINDYTGSYELLYASIKGDTSSRKVTIEASQIADYTDGKYEYYTTPEKTTTSKYSLASNFRLIYNGALYEDRTAVPGFSKTIDEMMEPKTGSVTLIDSDNNNTYDIAVVEDYVNYVVYSSNAETLTVGVKTMTETKTLDLSSAEAHMTVISHGGYVSDFDKITVNDVISVAVSANGKVAKIRIAVDRASGNLSATSNDTYTIGDKEYTLSKQYLDELNTLASKPKFGDSIELYLAYDGTVVYSKGSTDGDVKYGSLMSFYRDDDESLYVKLFSQDSSYNSYKIAKNATIDGMRYKNYDRMYEHMTTEDFTFDGRFKGMIRYKVNANGEISFIDLPYDENSETNPYASSEGENSLHIMKMNMLSGSEGYAGQYNKVGYSLEGEANVAQTALMFVFPMNDVKKPYEDAICTNWANGTWNGSFMQMLPFAVENGTWDAECVIRFNPTVKTGSLQVTTSGTKGHCLLMAVNDAINSNGEPTKKLKVLFEGRQMIDYTLENADTIECHCGAGVCKDNPIVAEPGDIIKFIADSNNMIPEGQLYVSYDRSTNTQYDGIKATDHALTVAEYAAAQMGYTHATTSSHMGIGYLNESRGTSAQFVFDFWPLRKSTTYLEVHYVESDVSLFKDRAKILSMRDAYVYEFSPSTGRLKHLTVSDLTQYRDGLNAKEKYVVVLKNYTPNMIIKYID